MAPNVYVPSRDSLKGTMVHIQGLHTLHRLGIGYLHGFQYYRNASHTLTGPDSIESAWKRAFGR